MINIYYTFVQNWTLSRVSSHKRQNNSYHNRYDTITTMCRSEREGEGGDELNVRREKHIVISKNGEDNAVQFRKKLIRKAKASIGQGKA